MKSFIKRVTSRVRRSLQSAVETKRQTFVARYQVLLKNNAEKANDFTIVIPVPSTIGAQRIASEPRFTPAAHQTGADERFGNQFAIWRVKLASGESRLFTEHFTVSVDAITKEISPDVFISGYGDKLAMYCAPSTHIESADQQIQTLAKEVVAGVTDIKTIISRINEVVMKRLEYGNPIHGLYSAKDALKQVKVDCGGYDSLFVALCIASGIPARIVSGFWAGYPKNEMHAWAEFQLPSGEWVPADSSTEALAREGRTHKIGKLGTLGSDRIIFSVGCDIPVELSGKKKEVAILQHPTIEASLGERSFYYETRVETTKA